MLKGERAPYQISAEERAALLPWVEEVRRTRAARRPALIDASRPLTAANTPAAEAAALLAQSAANGARMSNDLLAAILAWAEDAGATDVAERARQFLKERAR